jgi:hypothetical protein
MWPPATVGSWPSSSTSAVPAADPGRADDGRLNCSQRWPAGAANDIAENAGRDAGERAATEGGQAGRGAGKEPGEEPGGGKSEDGSSCKTKVPHSFVGATPVLMAHGT